MSNFDYRNPCMNCACVTAATVLEERDGGALGAGPRWPRRRLRLVVQEQASDSVRQRWSR